METVKKAKIELKYNSHNVTADFSPYIINLCYIDYEKDQSDELSITLKDNKNLFKNSWYPEKGAKLQCKIGFDNKPEMLNCGTFSVNENELSSDSDGDEFTISALAALINKPIRTTRTRPFDNKTLIQIASEIGTSHGFNVTGKEGNVFVGRQVQKGETDLGFLRRVSNQYGYVFKITNNNLYFLKDESLKNSNVLFELTKADISSLNLSDTCTKTYAKCTVKYYNPKTKKLKSYTASRTDATGEDTYKIPKYCNSLDVAKRLAVQGLKYGSKEITGSITLKLANFDAVAGVNFNLKGYEKFDGKYHIKSSRHTIDENGYRITIEVEKC